MLRLGTGFAALEADQLATRAELAVMRREIARQERRWRLVTGQAGTGELDRSAFYLDILQNLFSEDELRDLCFKLNIDFEALLASSKPGKARELIKFCQRHDRLKGLYGAVQVKRPYLFEENEGGPGEGDV